MSNYTRTAVVTGVTGCIGRHVVEQLKSAGWQVQGLTRADNIVSIRSLVADAVFHCAGATSGELYRDNVELTANLLMACKRGKVGRFIFTSTGAAHDPSSCEYAHTKWLAENLVKASGLNAVILQPCVVLGRYDTKHYCKLFKHRYIVFPGSMEFCWAQDVARAHLAAYYRGKPGESYLIAGQYLPWLDLAKEIAAVMGVPPPKKATSLRTLYSITRLMRVASWFTRKPPLMTAETVRLVTNGLPCPSEMRLKTVRDLDYAPTTTVRTMVEDCWKWMQQ